MQLHFGRLGFGSLRVRGVASEERPDGYSRIGLGGATRGMASEKRYPRIGNLKPASGE